MQKCRWKNERKVYYCNGWIHVSEGMPRNDMLRRPRRCACSATTENRLIVFQNPGQPCRLYQVKTKIIIKKKKKKERKNKRNIRGMHSHNMFSK